MSAEKLHPVVELLVKRMESNPEEFQITPDGDITGRWKQWIVRLGWHMTEAEKNLIYGKAREVMFQKAHEEVLDELCNGEERRRKRSEEWFLSNRSTLGVGTISPSQPLTINTGGNEVMRVDPNGTLHLGGAGGETLSPGMLKAIKGKLGL